MHRLDNESSDILKEFITEEHIDYQLTPADLHRRNWDERAIQTFKHHFISFLCSTDPNFPLDLCCKLVAQYFITLDLLSPSRINPKLSTHEQLFGNFKYNRTTMDPPGIKVLLRKRPEYRGSWSPHALSGCYIGPSLKNYLCHQIWIPATNSVRI